MNARKNIVRVEKNKNYTVINNTSLYDNRLSWKAKAIHTLMLSRPDDWTFHNEEMVRWAKDGIDAFNSGLNELKKYGYVKKEKRRDQNGRFEWITIVYEVPQENEQCTDSPQMEKGHMDLPHMENPQTDNPALLNTNKPNMDSCNTKTTNLPKAQQTSSLDDDGWAQLIAFYHQNIHPTPAPIFYEKLAQLYNQHPILELVLEALQLAVLHHAKNPIRYAESILIRWRSQHILSVKQARMEHQQKTATVYRAKPRRTEIVPEWFYKRKLNGSATKQAEPTDIDFEVERQKILSRLKRSPII